MKEVGERAECRDCSGEEWVNDHTTGNLVNLVSMRIYNPAAPIHNPAAPVYNPAAHIYNPAARSYNPAAPILNADISVGTKRSSGIDLIRAQQNLRTGIPHSQTLIESFPRQKEQAHVRKRRFTSSTVVA